MRKQLVQGMYAACAALAALPGVASAQQAQAVVNSRANLRAGPEQDYPVVAQLLPGTPVTVMGCVSDYSWCDVALPDLRGWIYAGLLSYPYQGNNVPLMSYGSTIGFPIVTFSIGNYWNDYYRGRPWYRDRDRWEHRPQPHFGGGGRPGGYRPPEMHRPQEWRRPDDHRQPDWNGPHGGGRPDFRQPGNNGGQWHPQPGRPPAQAGGGDHRGGDHRGDRHEGGGRPDGGQHNAGGQPRGGDRHEGGGRPDGGQRGGGGGGGQQHGGGDRGGGGQQHGGGDRGGGGQQHGGGDRGGHGQRGGDRDH